jgi:hypothetical protein
MDRRNCCTRTITQTAFAALTLGNFSGPFLISGVVSSLMMLISIMHNLFMQDVCTTARHANNSCTIDIAPGDEESRPLQTAIGNIVK